MRRSKSLPDSNLVIARICPASSKLQGTCMTKPISKAFLELDPEDGTVRTALGRQTLGCPVHGENYTRDQVYIEMSMLGADSSVEPITLDLECLPCREGQRRVVSEQGLWRCVPCDWRSKHIVRPEDGLCEV